MILNTCGGNSLILAGVSVEDVAVIVLSVLSVVKVTSIDSAERLERTFGALASVFVATGAALVSVVGAVLVALGAVLASEVATGLGAVLVATGVVLASEVATGLALAVDSATTVSGCVVSKFVVAVEPLFATLALVSIDVGVVCVAVVVLVEVFSSAWAT